MFVGDRAKDFAANKRYETPTSTYNPRENLLHVVLVGGTRQGIAGLRALYPYAILVSFYILFSTKQRKNIFPLFTHFFRLVVFRHIRNYTH